jgi:vancomycin permeability regulator SanA
MRRFVIAGSVLLMLFIAPTVFMSVRYGAETPSGSTNVALVLGAGLRSDGSPSPVLAARVMAGVKLYESKKVRKLVMSGDNSRALYDEVSAMKDLAVANGVPDVDVLLDYAGFRTLDSCVRIRKVFGQTRVVLVSQGFHLARARFLCADAGVATTTMKADDSRPRRDIVKSQVRELFARWAAVIDTKVMNRQPKFLGDPIDIDNPPPEALRQPAK